MGERAKSNRKAHLYCMSLLKLHRDPSGTYGAAKNEGEVGNTEYSRRFDDFLFDYCLTIHYELLY